MNTQVTREKLIDSFFELYADKPIEKISIKSLTDTAGYHRSTFYEYFVDIYDVLEKEEDEILSLAESLILNPILNNEINPFNTAELMQHVSRLYELKGERIAILIGSNGDGRFRVELVKRMKNAIISALNTPVENVQLDYFLEFISSGMMSIINKCYTERTMTIREIVAFLHPVLSKLASEILNNTSK